MCFSPPIRCQVRTKLKLTTYQFVFDTSPSYTVPLRDLYCWCITIYHMHMKMSWTYFLVTRLGHTCTNRMLNSKQRLSLATRGFVAIGSLILFPSCTFHIHSRSVWSSDHMVNRSSCCPLELLDIRVQPIIPWLLRGQRSTINVSEQLNEWPACLHKRPPVAVRLRVTCHFSHCTPKTVYCISFVSHYPLD